MKALPNELVDFVGTPMQRRFGRGHRSGPVHYLSHIALQLWIQSVVLFCSLSVCSEIYYLVNLFGKARVEMIVLYDMLANAIRRGM